MKNCYTDEKNVLILIALLKMHDIRKVIVSPGTTNITFVASIQGDPFFELYSAIDERSAAYMACGLSVESGEPVVLSCTMATASRNYVSGLTEAFYRKIPILAVTSTLHIGQVGQNIPQLIDRSQIQKDIVKISMYIPPISTKEDEWDCEVKISTALLELKRQGGGPVHINLCTQSSQNYLQQELPRVRKIERISQNDSFPLMIRGKVGIYVGAHRKWSKELVDAVDTFCENYNGLVLCDHTSNYTGKYGVFASLLASQEAYRFSCCLVDVMIHIGDISGASWRLFPKNVWRVNPDGEVRDTFHKLKYVFEMEEIVFFQHYNKLCEEKQEHTYYKVWETMHKKVAKRIPELPFSNIWIAKQTARRIPADSVLYLGILNSLRSWNFFETACDISGYANTGGFGIDGGVSALLGASLTDINKLYFGIVGDLAFFYDMNAIGNRHIGNNVRIMVINNGKGTEFKNYHHPGNRFGDEADLYIAGAGHFGNQSRKLIKHYAQDLGFQYLSAENKKQYQSAVEKFIDSKIDTSIIFEIFTDSVDESNALKTMRNLVTNYYEREDIYEIVGKGEFKRVGIYAISKTARQIVEAVNNMKELENIEIFLYDTNEKVQGTFVESREVLSPQYIEESRLDCLIIASDLYYDEIYEKYCFLEKQGVQIRGLLNV